MAYTAPIEIEARIGYLGEKNMFISGISEPIFNLLQRLLVQERSLLLQPDVVETDYIFERPEEGNYRVTVMGDPENQRVINAGFKTKRNDTILTGLTTDSHYSVRISVSTEIEEEDKPDQVALNWSMCRKKTRSSFTNSGTVPVPGGASVVVPWRIDLTRVETTRPMRQDAVKFDPSIVTFELELEMPPLNEDPSTSLKTKVLSFNDGISLMMCALGYANRNSDGPLRWTPPSQHVAPGSAPPSQHPPASIAKGPSIVNNLTEQRNRMILDPNRHPDFPTMHLEKIPSSQYLRVAFDRCLKDHPQFDTHNRFLGTMPINFARRHIEQVRRQPYWISEKTDGVRFLLFITRASPTSQSPASPHASSSSGLSSSGSLSPPQCYLIDRSNTHFRVPGFFHLAPSLSPNSDTILDGEMVKRFNSEDYYFLIFDAIAVDGAAVWNQSMSERLSHISNVVSAFTHASSTSALKLPFSLLAKEIMPKEKFESVRSKIVIQSDGETSVYGSPSSSHYHLTDGLIFMPECHYPLYTCQNMFKWKFVDRQTIDFEITFPHPNSEPGTTLPVGPTTVELHIGGNSSTTVHIKTVPLPQADFDRLQNDIRHSFRPNLVIAEMGFDGKTGLWRYHKLRPDKDKPNYISIAIDTMESIAENITLEELVVLLR
jgi:mRNA guanylyltransferase